MKKRREGLQQQQQLPASAQLELLPKMEAGIISADHNEQLWAITQFRMLLSAECSPPIEEVIQSGVVPCFVYFLRSDDSPRLQFEAAWVLTNIASGTIENIRVLLAHNAVSKLTKLLVSPSDDVCEQAMWALINIANGTNDEIQAVIDAGVCPRLVEFLTHPSPFPSSIMKEACWTISNITAGNKEQIHAVIEAKIIGPLVHLLQNAEFDVKKEAAWAISNATYGGTHEQIKYLHIAIERFIGTLAL
ncbi:hypothetical protein Q3G72_014330 [Acer saccharum]|nr:hypothetical protein Q3G72_014330 [Acer saccharum]